MYQLNVVAQEEEFTQDEEEFSQTPENDAIALFNKGQEAHAKGELKLALEFYGKALKANPLFPEAAYQSGIIYKALNKRLEAEKFFQKKFISKKDWSLPYVQLGLLFFEKSNFVEAEKFLSEALRLDGTSYMAYAALSDVLVKTKASPDRLQSLIPKLKTLSNGKNVPVALWTSKAMVERKLGRIDAASASLSNAFKLDPNDKVMLSEFVEIHLIKGEYDQAIQVSKTLLKSDPNSRNAKLLLARSYNEKGDTDRALTVLKTIDNPGKEILSFQTAIETNGNLSVERLEEMLGEDKDNASVLGRLCSLTRASTPRKALVYCKKALTIEKNNINHAIGYGAVLVQLKQYGNAVAVLRNLLKHSPENYTIHANLATAFFQMQNFGAARIEYEWIIRKRPELAVAHYFLAISLID